MGRFALHIVGDSLIHLLLGGLASGYPVTTTSSLRDLT